MVKRSWLPLRELDQTMMPFAFSPTAFMAATSSLPRRVLRALGWAPGNRRATDQPAKGERSTRYDLFVMVPDFLFVAHVDRILPALRRGLDGKAAPKPSRTPIGR